VRGLGDGKGALGWETQGGRKDARHGRGGRTLAIRRYSRDVADVLSVPISTAGPALHPRRYHP
jgi:hypothetical protein